MADFVTIETEKGRIELETRVFDNVQQLKPLLSETGWRLVGLLRKRPSYPAEIAKKLGIHEQKVYYYIKQLKNMGLIQLNKTEERHGATAKFYTSNIDCFTLIPSREELAKRKEFVVFKKEKREMDAPLKEFFEPFISNGKLNAKIVVGSPDPHGKYKARARDGHFAVELAAFLGSMSKEISLPLIFLDTMIPSLENENSNLIIIGGLITNKLTAELNKKMPIQFLPSGGHWIIKSTVSDREYVEDSIGVIQKIRHPYFPQRSILSIAGKRNSGTMAAIVALIRKTNEMAKPNQFNEKEYAKVVEGLDIDCDGLIDDVEVKE